MRTYALKLLQLDIPDAIASAEDELRIARASDSAQDRLICLSCALDYLDTAKQLVRRIERPTRYERSSR